MKPIEIIETDLQQIRAALAHHPRPWRVRLIERAAGDDFDFVNCGIEDANGESVVCIDDRGPGFDDVHLAALIVAAVNTSAPEAIVAASVDVIEMQDD